jgi:predicted NBD/HSP70 family sugar kinase
VLDLVRRYGPISKSDLSERSGLAVSSVLNILGSLRRHDLIREVGLGPSTGGRPPTLFELNPNARYAAGANIHPTGVDALLLDLAGDIVTRTDIPLQGGMGVEGVARTVGEAIEQVLLLAHVDPGRILGTGVGLPWPVREGQVVEAIDAPEWIGVDFASLLERRLGIPVLLDSSANLCALAEYRHGAGHKDHGSLLYMYADHTIAHGLVIDGTVYRGADGLTGDIGHLVVDADGPACTCGNYGCLEALASVQAITKRVMALGKLNGAPMVGGRAQGDWDSVSYAAIADAVERGDPVTTRVVDEALGYLAIGVSNVASLLRPDVIVVGGEFFHQESSTFERFKAAVARRQTRMSVADMLRCGELGATAASVGAATLVLEDFFGVPEHVMRSEPEPEATELAFESPLIWPEHSGDSVLLAPTETSVVWAGNMQPMTARIRTGESITVAVDVTLDRPVAADHTGVKALLHWDRVALFGGHWPNPKNSPMQCISTDGTTATYSATLGSLPPGKYEFAAHIVGANDIWVPTVGAREPNGRLEVLPSRVFAREQAGRRRGRKEGERARVRATS